MPKVRRNDPCPCGSGKKYKNCCMRRDRVSASRELNLRDSEALLLNALYEYAQSPRFNNDSVEAFQFYWGGVYTMEGVSQPNIEDMRRTTEWFIHDYHTHTDRRTILDLFIENVAVDVPIETQSILQAWSQSIMGLFRVVDRAEGDRLGLYDCLRQEDLRIGDMMLSRNTQRGDLLIGRLFELDGTKRLSMMTMILPEEYEPGLVEYVTNAYNLYRDEHYQATWDEFLRECGHIFNAYLLSPRAESLRSLIGPGTRFHDPAITRDELRELTREREVETLEEMRAVEERQSPEHRTASGIILPGAVPQEEQPAPEEGRSVDERHTEQEEKPARSTILIPGRDF